MRLIRPSQRQGEGHGPPFPRPFRRHPQLAAVGDEVPVAQDEAQTEAPDALQLVRVEMQRVAHLLPDVAGRHT